MLGAEGVFRLMLGGGTGLGMFREKIFKIFYFVVDMSVRGGSLIITTWILR
jgi:hypothetical protein